MVHFGNRHLEVSHTNSIISALSQFFGTIVHGVEFTDLVRISNFFKEVFDLLSGLQFSKVLLLDSQLSVARWEKEIDGFRLITVVLKFKNNDLFKNKNLLDNQQQI